MATKEIERDIGEIKGVLEGIKTEIENLHNDQSNIFARMGKVEQTVVVSQENIININKRIDKMCEEKIQEKEAERSATNTKLTIIGIILAAIEVVMGIIIAVAHV